MKKSRIRSLILPVGLAVIALVLIGVYMASYRSSVDNGAELVKVLVAARDIPAGTGGSAVASGDYLKSQTVPRRAVVPGSVVSEASLTSQVVADPIYEGEQITLRQFAPKTQGGVFAKFSGKERAVAVLGEPHQLLAGTLTAGDHVDVVATARYSAGGPSRATTTRRPPRPARARGAGRRRADRGRKRRDDHRDARHDRSPDPDDGLGDEDEHLVPRAAADGEAEGQQGRARDAALVPGARPAEEQGVRPDRRGLPGERR